MFIPELRLELTSGTLGGKFTTIGIPYLHSLNSFLFDDLKLSEGLLSDIENSLKQNPFTGDGDSHGSFTSSLLFEMSSLIGLIRGYYEMGCLF